MRASGSKNKSAPATRTSKSSNPAQAKRWKFEPGSLRLHSVKTSNIGHVRILNNGHAGRREKNRLLCLPRDRRRKVCCALHAVTDAVLSVERELKGVTDQACRQKQWLDQARGFSATNAGWRSPRLPK